MNILKGKSDDESGEPVYTTDDGDSRCAQSLTKQLATNHERDRTCAKLKDVNLNHLFSYFSLVEKVVIVFVPNPIAKLMTWMMTQMRLTYTSQ